MAQVFISHSSRDVTPAAQLLEWLRAQGFTHAFLDFDKHAGLAPGADWERTLYREIATSDAVILILTANWLDSKWCFAEFTQARALGKPIFPLIESPRGEGFASRDIQSLDLVSDRQCALERLAGELNRIILGSRRGFAWDCARPPFPGLLAFDEADAAIFFGRDDDIRRIIERLNARRTQGGPNLITLLGASGCGKSSLVRAGVLPRLQHDKHNWIVLPPFRPQVHPLDELAQAVAVGFGRGSDWRKWREAFSAKEPKESLLALVRDLRVAQSANEAQVLISIDQAEELFTTAEGAEAEHFLRVLNAALGEDVPIIVLMGLRSDYLSKLQQAPMLSSPFEQLSLKPMPVQRVRDVIEGPARVAGLTVEEGLVAAAAGDAVTEDTLPLLAFALRELYDRCATGCQLTVEAYRALGDETAGLSPLENAVRRRADAVLETAKPSAEDLQALKEAFVPAMVGINAEGQYVRRRAQLTALAARARPLIDRLAAARLLVLWQDGGTAFVEVAHEALLGKWPLLRGWLDEEREFLIGKNELEQDLKEWQQAPEDRKTEALLTGIKLTKARAWLAAKSHQLSEGEREFIAASAAFHDEEIIRTERLERLRWRTKVASAAAVVLLSATALTTWKWVEAGEATSSAIRIQARYDVLKAATTVTGQKLDSHPDITAREIVADLAETVTLMDSKTVTEILSLGITSKKILWFDVSPQNNVNERAAFNKMGFAVDQVADIDRAVGVGRVDMIITHFGLRPGGKERSDAYLLKRALEKRGAKLPPIVIYSVNVSDQQACQAQRDGFYDDADRPAQLFAIAFRVVQGLAAQQRCPAVAGP